MTLSVDDSSFQESSSEFQREDNGVRIQWKCHLNVTRIQGRSWSLKSYPQIFVRILPRNSPLPGALLSLVSVPQFHGTQMLYCFTNREPRSIHTCEHDKICLPSGINDELLQRCVNVAQLPWQHRQRRKSCRWLDKRIYLRKVSKAAHRSLVPAAYAHRSRPCDKGVQGMVIKNKQKNCPPPARPREMSESSGRFTTSLGTVNVPRPLGRLINLMALRPSPAHFCQDAWCW